MITPESMLKSALADPLDRLAWSAYCDLVEEGGGRRPEWAGHWSGPLPSFLSGARTLFSRLPITSVTFTDREPLYLPAFYAGRLVRLASEYGLYASVHWDISPHSVPGDFFLGEPPPEFSTVCSSKTFTSRRAAMSWLSDSAVNVGRAMAGLGPLRRA